MTGNKDKDRVLKKVEEKGKRERKYINRTNNVNTEIDVRLF